MSQVTLLTAQHFSSIGRAARSLFRRLPLSQWRPTRADISILRGWILPPSTNATSDGGVGELLTAQPDMLDVPRLLAQEIIGSLNWGHVENKEEEAGGGAGGGGVGGMGRMGGMGMPVPIPVPGSSDLPSMSVPGVPGMYPPPPPPNPPPPAHPAHGGGGGEGGGGRHDDLGCQWNRLFLTPSTHRAVAVILAEAHVEYELLKYILFSVAKQLEAHFFS